MLKEWKPKKGKSIFRKVLFGNLLLVCAALMLFSALTLSLVRNYIIESNCSELQDKARSMASDMNRPLDWPLIRAYQSLADAQVLIVGTDYVAIQSPRKMEARQRGMDAEAGLSYTEVLSRMDKRIIDSIFGGNSLSGVEEVEFLSEQVVYAGVPLTAGSGELIGAMMLFRPLRDVRVMWARVATYLLFAAGLSICAALALATVLSKSITRPLLVMNDTAKRMSEGDYDRRAPIFSRDEVGQLGETLNELSARLSGVITKLQSEKSKLEQILLSLGEGIVAFDREGHILTHNPAALALLEIDAWETAPDAMDADSQRKNVANMLVVCMDTGEKETATFKSASGRALAATACPVRVPDGTIIGAVCLIRDVSEEERLEQLRREYIANVSHELRTPLTGIRGMVEPLVDGILETESEKIDCYQVIYKETLRLEKLIGEMLDMSRLQDGRLQIQLEAIELAGVMERAISPLRRTAQDASVRLTLNARAPIACMGSEDRVIQVLIILIDNALSFTPAGGEITVFAQPTGAKVRIGVRDTGAGIEQKHLPYIWERFYKADKSRMRTTGTGLGLAIAKLVVERMGGDIGVTTELGKGTEFVFTLNAPPET